MTPSTGWLHDAPTLLLSVPLWLAMLAAGAVGAWIARRARRDPDVAHKEDGYVLSAVLGLLALLIAFTFGLALNRHEERRALVVTEANALGTAWLRTALLDDPVPVRALMREYTRERVAYGHTDGATRDAHAARAAQLQSRLWDAVLQRLAPQRGTAAVPVVVAPFNEAFDAATSRQAALEARLPDTVLLALGLYCVMSAGMLGFTLAASGVRDRLPPVMLFALLTLAVGLVLDLDRPRSGSIQVPQGAMHEVLGTMEAR